jgi:predicted nucleic acid-binding Zn ribbon protein
MQRIADALPSAIAELLRGSPLCAAKVEFAWKTAVGPALQRATAVRLEQGVLLVDASSREWALEVARSSRMILARLKTLLGDDVIREITIRA